MLWFAVFFFSLLTSISGSAVEQLILQLPFDGQHTLDLIRQTDTSDSALQSFVRCAIYNNRPEVIKCICTEFPISENAMTGLFNDALMAFAGQQKEEDRACRYECVLVLLKDVHVQPRFEQMDYIHRMAKTLQITQSEFHRVFIDFVDHGFPVTVQLLNSIGSYSVLFELCEGRLPDASLNDKDYTGQTVLLYAGRLEDRKKAYELTKRLLERGADPNLASNATSPLVQALNMGFYDIALLLMRSGAEINDFVKRNYSVQGLSFCHVLIPKMELLLGSKCTESDSVFSLLPHEIIDEIAVHFIQDMI